MRGRLRRSDEEEMNNAKKSVEEVPKILRPELHDVFPIFASMLDFSSFTKLSMTSKEMHRRCMEKNSITMNLEKVKLGVSSRSLDFSFEVAKYEHLDLQKLPCKATVRTLEIKNSAQPDIYEGSMVKRMKNYGIIKIHELNIKDAMDEETITSIIKEFSVKSVNIDRSITVDALRSILQLNIEKFSYHDEVDIDFILEIETPIPEIQFLRVLNTVSKEKFMNLLSKIQSGSLPNLTMNNSVIDWDNFKMLPFDQKGSLPDERPLVLTRTLRSGASEYWFLHSDGGITKCVICGPRPTKLQMSKWEQMDLPSREEILRNAEEILKDLAEKLPIVPCSVELFHIFSAGFTMIDASHKGRLPNARPLYCKDHENRFWMLDEDENLMECKWNDGNATWTPFDPCNSNCHDMGHPALVRHMFWELLKQVEGSDEFFLYSDKDPKFLNGRKTLEMDYSGVLPDRRPLIFRRSSHAHYCTVLSIILLEDNRLIECRIHHSSDVRFKLCHPSNRPNILYTAETVVEILKKPKDENWNFNIRFEIFREGLEQFKKSLLALQKRLLIFETSKTEFWYILDGVARKADWKQGRLSISEEADLLNCPSSLVFRFFAENPEKCDSSPTMELEEFRKCLEQFTVVPFDYCGPLTNDSLAFVKNEIRHTCRKGPTRRPRCKCDAHSILVWILWNGKRVTKCSWGKEEPKKIVFGDSSSLDGMEVPAMLKSKEYLQNLLETKYYESSEFEWFGSVDDFLASFDEYWKHPLNDDSSLLPCRPILFVDFDDEENPNRFILREDGTVIKCEWLQSDSVLSLFSPSYDDLPLALKNVL